MTGDDLAREGTSREAALARIRAIIDAAEPFPPFQEARPSSSVSDISGQKKKRKKVAKGAERKKRTPQRDSLLDLLDDVELWHDASGDAFATFPTNAHREHRAIRSREFRQWLSLIFLEQLGGALGGQAIEDALRVLEARAVHHGCQHETWRRVGRRGEKLYLDLCDVSWRAVEISGGGWSVIDEAPVKFLRTPAMRSLPQPESGELVERLGGFINFATDDDLLLATAWLVMAFRPGGPFPILDLVGEQGSGKTAAAKLMRALVDPNDAPLRSVPRDERDLIVTAVNAHVLAFDNLSGMSGWFADGLCRIATGSGYSTRRLHTDREEEVFAAARPIILNGIPNLTDRADLADRALAIHLPNISEDRRRPESDFWRDFEAAAPGILGALLDAVSAALRNLPTTKADRLPRMADFALWVSAAEQGLGWEKGSFVAAYERNRQSIFEDAAEADPLVLVVRDQWPRLSALSKVALPDGWEGTPGDLLADLNSITDDGTRKSRAWPSTPSALGTRIKRAAPTLRRCGFIVESRHSGSRIVRILRRERS